MAFSGLTAGQIAVLARTPALDPPPGVSPNFDPRYRVKPYLYSVLISTLALLCVTLCVAIRIYSRNYISKKLWWDDYLCVLAWLGLISFTIVGILMIKHGAGIHQWNLYADLYVRIMYIRYIADAVYTFTILITKVSILLQYLRILVPNRYWSKGLYYTTHFLIWTNVLFFNTEAVLFLCGCTPRAKIWNRKLPGHCISIANFSITAVFNIVSDFCILILPLHTIWHLQMDRRRKVGISLIFGTGGFACVTSIMRLGYSLKIIRSEDKSFLQLGVHGWMYAEISVGIICGCLPSLPLFIRHIKSYAQSRSQRRSTWGRKLRMGSKGAQKLEDQIPEFDIREQSQFDQSLGTLRTVSEDLRQSLAATKIYVGPSKQENAEGVPKEDPG